MGIGKLFKKLKPILRIGVALSGKRDEIDALGKVAGDLGGKRVKRVVDKIGRIDGDG